MDDEVAAPIVDYGSGIEKARFDRGNASESISPNTDADSKPKRFNP